MTSLFRSNHGSIFVYVLILASISMTIGYILFQTNVVIYRALEDQEIQSILNRNITTKAERAIALGKIVNTNGGGFQNTLSCPLVTLSGQTSKQDVLTQHFFDGSLISCAGIYPASSSSGANLFLYFSPDFLSYTGASYLSLDVRPLAVTSTGYSATFSDGDQTVALWNNDHPRSGVDANMNSDNFRSDSASGVSYSFLSGSSLGTPLGDDDSLARKMITGFASYGHGYINVYWNTPRLSDYVKKNPNNALWSNSGQVEPLGAFIGDTATGFVHMELDNDAELLVIEYDLATYRASQTRKVLSKREYTLSGGSIGYLTSSGITQQAYSDAIGSGALAWNFRDNMYALFVRARSGANNAQSQLRYTFRVRDSSAKDVYIAPLIDTMQSDTTGLWKYWSNDILLLDSGKQYALEGEIVRSFNR